MAPASSVKLDHHRHALRTIRNVYLYMVAMIGLIVFLFGAVSIVNNVFKTYVFQVDDYSYYSPYQETACTVKQLDPADPTGKSFIEHTSQEIAECEGRMAEQMEKDKRRNIGYDFSIGIAQIVVGLPVWLFHWGIIQKEYRRKEEEKES